jgi:hypothetical protein
MVFADAMPGKYDLFEETIGLVKVGGFISLMICYLNPIGRRVMRIK